MSDFVKKLLEKKGDKLNENQKKLIEGLRPDLTEEEKARLERLRAGSVLDSQDSIHDRLSRAYERFTLETKDPESIYSPENIAGSMSGTIKKVPWKKASTFLEALNTARKESPMIDKYVGPYTEKDYKKMKLYLSPDKKSGFAVKSDGDIVNLFSTEKGRGKELITKAKAEGGTKLDHFESSKLDELYEGAGFGEIKREKNWTPGEPDVIFRALDAKKYKDMIDKKATAKEILENMKKKDKK